MKPILIVYGTIEGQTAKIASFVAQLLKKEGFLTEVLDASSADSIKSEKYAAIIAGAPIHVSRFPSSFTHLIAESARDFSKIPTAFFSVCLGVMQKDEPETQAAEKDFVLNFFKTTGWSPDKWTIFAGAVRYSRYGFFKRHLMHFILRLGGQQTELDRDYEYTDWSEVRKFATDFARILRANEVPSIGPT